MKLEDLLETLVFMERNNLDHLIRTGQAIKWRKGIEQLQQENEHNKNILTEFEKWLEEEMKRKNSRWEQFRNQINTQELVLERLNAQIIFIDCCLKRLQELKEGKK